MANKISTKEMIEMFKSGYSMQDIAYMAGITRQAVALRLRRKGISAQKKETTTPTNRH